MFSAGINVLKLEKTGEDPEIQKEQPLPSTTKIQQLKKVTIN